MKKVVIAVVLFCITYQTGIAQLCTGSLGDPVVNISFGNDQTLKAPLKPGVTNLNYTNTGCPNDGQYTLTNLSFGCFNNTWHLLAGDHTGDIGGRYMLINASLAPNDFYVDTVQGLCSNTVYEFASWVCNVLKSSACGINNIKPNLSFSIETINGTVIKKIETGDIPTQPEKVWQQYGTFFQTPAGVSTVVLRIRNNAPGGCGNDLALDDITFRPCGPKIAAYAGADTTGYLYYCENNQTDLVFTATYSSGFNDPVIQWQFSVDTGRSWIDIPGETKLIYTRKPTGKGRYLYRASIVEKANIAAVTCRIASNVTNITVSPLPKAPPNHQLQGCTGTSLRLPATEGTGFSYTWSGPNGFTDSVPSPLISNLRFSDAGWYLVNIATDLGCFRTDSLLLSVFPGASAKVSNDQFICEGSNTQLVASGGIGYLWEPATGLSANTIANPVAAPTDSTQYKVTVTNQYGCKNVAYTVVNVWKKAVVSAGVDQQIFEGNSVVLNGKIAGAASSFYWTPGIALRNGNSLTPEVSPVTNTLYQLVAISNVGCGTVSDEVLVKVYRKVVAPNAFTPNGDGIHDTWEIRGLDSYPDSELSIYNRTGQKVFQAKAYTGGWDARLKGKPLPVGTYYYVIDLHIGQPAISGWILIMR